jgi:altronate dehydratase small subunit
VGRLAIVMHGRDNVATAVTDIPARTNVKIEVEGRLRDIEVIQPISLGHKFAIRHIVSGEDIVKYGEVIGVATREIGVGEHVHISNVESKRGRGDLTGRTRG